MGDASGREERAGRDPQRVRTGVRSKWARDGLLNPQLGLWRDEGRSCALESSVRGMKCLWGPCLERGLKDPAAAAEGLSPQLGLAETASAPKMAEVRDCSMLPAEGRACSRSRSCQAQFEVHATASAALKVARRAPPCSATVPRSLPTDCFPCLVRLSLAMCSRSRPLAGR